MEKKLKLYSLYDYIKIIFYIKYSTGQKNNFLFDKYHFNFLSKVQQFSTT